MPPTATTAVETAKLAGTVARDMSFTGLFMQADTVVKAVMIGLLFASIWAWTIIFEKWSVMRKVSRSARVFEEAFWSGGSPDKLYDRVVTRAANDPMIAVFVAGMKEWQTAIKSGTILGVAQAATLQARITQVMHNTIGREMDRIERRMTFLASLGSAAPFIGLFGTVWGIMRSFIAIAAAENTSLPVVAPAIAEALLATAMGLVAAVPAVLAYNKFSSDIGRYGSRLEAFVNDFIVILSRNLQDGQPSGQLPRPGEVRPTDTTAPAPRFGT